MPAGYKSPLEHFFYKRWYVGVKLHVSYGIVSHIVTRVRVNTRKIPITQSQQLTGQMLKHDNIGG